MPHIHIFLQQLDELYHAGDFDQYEQYWHKACQHAEHFFPGFTIAYAELYTSGIDRISDGSMRMCYCQNHKVYNRMLANGKGYEP